MPEPAPRNDVTQVELRDELAATAREGQRSPYGKPPRTLGRHRLEELRSLGTRADHRLASIRAWIEANAVGTTLEPRDPP